MWRTCGLSYPSRVLNQRRVRGVEIICLSAVVSESCQSRNRELSWSVIDRLTIDFAVDAFQQSLEHLAGADLEEGTGSL